MVPGLSLRYITQLRGQQLRYITQFSAATKLRYITQFRTTKLRYITQFLTTQLRYEVSQRKMSQRVSRVTFNVIQMTFKSHSESFHQLVVLLFSEGTFFFEKNLFSIFFNIHT